MCVCVCVCGMVASLARRERGLCLFSWLWIVHGPVPKAIYQLKNATCFYEERNSSALPKWLEGTKVI